MDQNSEDNRNNRRSDSFSDRRRSIRDISLSEELKGKRRPARSTRGDGSKKSYYKRGSGAAKYGVLALVVTLIIFGGFFAISALSRATLTVEPRSERVSVNEEVTISESSIGGTALSYEVFSLEETASELVEGGEERQVERSAEGRITIYNTNPNDQALIARTRFESESGNIYRISNSVMVPAARGETPGSLTVTVTADEVGEDSNMTSGRFTIPGLEGTELYEEMYAEVESAIEGGFVGTERSVSEADAEEALESIQSALTVSLQQKAASSLPSEYILVPGSTFLEFQELPRQPSGDSVSVRTKGTIYGVILKKDLLASYLALEYLSDYQNSPLEIRDPESLAIELDKNQLTLEDIEDEITLRLRGEVVLGWQVDEAYLREMISGVARNEAVNLAASTPGVRSARLELVPSFMRSIPTSLEKIDVRVVDEL